MTVIRILHLPTCACLAVMLVAAAEAQDRRGPGGQGARQRGGFGQRGGGPGGFGGGGPRGGRGTISRVTLLGSDDVKDDLSIDDGQDATIKAAIEAFQAERDSSRPDRSVFEGLSEEERNSKIEEMRAERDKLTKQTEEIVVALLDEEQVKRLDEILVQAQLAGGISRFLESEERRKELSVTDEQIEKLKEVQEASRAAQMEMFAELRNSGGFGRRGDDGGAEQGERPDFRSMFEKLRKEAEEKAQAVLTDAQKASLEEMKGEPVEFDFRSLMGRGGRGGPGGGRGGDRGGRGGPGGARGGRGGQGGEGGARQRPALDDAI